MKAFFKRAALSGLASLLLGSTAFGQALTTAFTFQGELRNGGSLVDGVYDMRFRLYTGATAGNQVGATLCSDNVVVSNGRCTVQLDFGAQFAGQQRFLEVDVRQDTGLGCTNSTGFTTLGPRQALTATPHAVYSLNAGAATSATTATNATQLNGQGGAFYTNAANLTGVLPSAGLSGTYGGTLNLTNSSNIFTGSGAGLTSLNASNLASGTLSAARLPVPLSLVGTDPAQVIRSENTATTGAAAGLFGLASGTSGATYGVRGENASGAGFGVYGLATASSGNSRGVYGGTLSPTGAGVMGESTNGAAGAVYALTHSATGYGVYAWADSSTGSPTAVYGQTTSATGYGGYFVGNGYFSGNLLVGTTSSPDGGRFLVDSSGLSIWARTTDNLSSAIFCVGSGGGVCKGIEGRGMYGVYGSIVTGGTYAMYSQGNFGASGSKSFRIDDPRDPENKYLLHYCIESPEVLNAYTGKVTLDGQGEATIDLPPYFAAINKDPRYTLTPIGAAMPLLHIAEEVDEAALAEGAKVEPGEPVPGAHFRIAGGAANAKVSWRVEAVRNDRWMQKHPSLVEQDKPAEEKGKYQHPDLYGQPVEKGVTYRPGSDGGSK